MPGQRETTPLPAALEQYPSQLVMLCDGSYPAATPWLISSAIAPLALDAEDDGGAGLRQWLFCNTSDLKQS